MQIFCCRKNPYFAGIACILFLYLFWDTIFALLEDDRFGQEKNGVVPLPPNEMDRDCQCRSLTKEKHSGTRLPQYCSDYSAIRGPNQRLISFSIYEKILRKHYVGIFENLDKVKKYYPKYVMRVYHDLKPPIFQTKQGKEICKLYCSEPQLDLCNVRYIDTYRNLVEYDWSLWRFTPMVDPLVSEFHSRDLDTRVSQREKDAVNDWIARGATYHIMRDHPTHDSRILGGMFGMKYRNKNALHTKHHFEKMLLNSRRTWRPGIDREMLGKYVWPKAKYDMVAHDSYLCTKSSYSYSGNKPWPSKRIDGENQNFVGSRLEDDMISLETPGQCPIKCRPKQYEEWLLC